LSLYFSGFDLFGELTLSFRGLAQQRRELESWKENRNLEHSNRQLEISDKRDNRSGVLKS